tara:strand:- start:590 stop:790 length:201 start_codon:yes stop_codon:yes gene_type:complete
MKHISEIIDEALPSLIAAEAHATSGINTDEARATAAGLSVEEYTEAMNEACEYQEWLELKKESEVQ